MASTSSFFEEYIISRVGRKKYFYSGGVLLCHGKLSALGAGYVPIPQLGAVNSAAAEQAAFE